MTKILLLDDDLRLNTIIKIFLKNNNYSVDAATTADEAWEYVKNRNYDLIILDIILRESDGIKICNQIRKYDIKTPILFITALLGKKDLFQGFQAGGDDYMTKPLDWDEFLLRIKALLRRNKQNTSSIEEKKVKLNLHLEDIFYKFKNSLLDDLNQLKNYVISDDQENEQEAIRIAHSLKGTLGNFKFLKCSKELSKQIEFDIINKIKNSELINKIEQVYEEVNNTKNQENLTDISCNDYIDSDEINFSKEPQNVISQVNKNQKISILIVEDELLIGTILERKLKQLNYDVLGIVSSGIKAIEFTKENQPDLVLMDIVITGEINGIETAEIIYKTYNIPVVYLSAYTDDETIEKAGKTGSYGYIIKPFQDKELHATIKMAYSKHKQSSNIINTLKTAEKNNQELQNTVKSFNSQDENILETDFEKDLKKALKQEEFEIYYQPRIDLKTGKISGAEALLRWINPEKGFISPAKFIPVAEKIGLINMIGEWVFLNVCRQTKLWHSQGVTDNLEEFKNLHISFNLSPLQLQQDNLEETLIEIIHNLGLEPHFLEIELTEGILIENSGQIIKKLNALKNIGFQIAIDDFGTGYSSLSYIQNLPLDILKIDRCFVNNIHLNPKNQTITDTIISMAHKLNLIVIAEGVETQEELDILSQYNCDQIQGYFFSKPLSVKTFEEFVTTRIKQKI